MITILYQHQDSKLFFKNFNLFFELEFGMTVHHQYNDVSNQQDATTFSFINLFKSALHVSGDKFTHPQEHSLTVYKSKSAPEGWENLSPETYKTD